MVAIAGLTGRALCEDSASVEERFADPSRDYSTGPLWTWNDMLTEQQVRSSLRDLAAQRVRQVWVHPRPGLMTPYLEQEWFDMWAASLDEARRLDMNVWIYDENSYPSGFAGGLVPEAMPDSRCVNLIAKEHKTAPPVDQSTVGVFRLSDAGFDEVTAAARSGGLKGAGRYLVVSRKLCDSAPWFGGKWYVDLLKPGVTEKFLEITLEPYRKRFGDEFGARIPGVFTDEPNLFRSGGAPWTPGLPELFQERWGYSLTANLPSLFRPVGDWQRLRHNYFQLLLEQFIERWAMPYYEYCEENSLEFTGHYWEHGWPQATHAPDNMAMYAWHHRPAIDTLFNRYEEHTGAQFGNVRSVRELASVANQLGRERTLCEAYGAGGWDLRIEDMKRIGDWLYVLGVNTLNEHIACVTIRGARKRDHPQSFSYHTPWFEAYHVLAGYFTRLSVALSAGRQVNDILVIEPTTTAWLHQSQFDPSQKPILDRIGSTFFDLLMSLERAQLGYDIGCEDIMTRWGKTDGSSLIVGQRSYHTVVIPPMTENLNGPVVELLESYVKAGGIVLACGDAPALIDGRPSKRLAALAGRKNWRAVETDKLPGVLSRRPGASPLEIHRDRPQEGILFHHCRVLDDGVLLFLVNTSIEHGVSGHVQATSPGSVRQWDLHTGEVLDYPYETSAQGARPAFNLPPCGSLLLFFSNRSGTPAPVTEEQIVKVPADGHMKIDRLGPNVLTLDFVDVTAGGETRSGVYCAGAGDFVFQKHGMDGNPWSRAVQFHDELITKKFPPDSGFEATYRFTIDGPVPPELAIVIERADLYEITCNGKPVEPTPDAWWLDKSFGKVPIASAARTGRNAVTITARPLTVWHELEPAYVLGDFALRPAESGFAIVPPGPLELKADGTGWNAQGHPFYGHGVAYTQTFNVEQPKKLHRVRLGRWYGSTAKIVVNGHTAGYIGWRPWQLDVSEFVKPGENTIEVVVIGTLKNTLGPHHIPGLRGIAGPAHFAKGPATGPPPGSSYDTIPYGLFEPFTLEYAR